VRGSSLNPAPDWFIFVYVDLNCYHTLICSLPRWPFLSFTVHTGNKGSLPSPPSSLPHKSTVFEDDYCLQNDAQRQLTLNTCVNMDSTIIRYTHKSADLICFSEGVRFSARPSPAYSVGEVFLGEGFLGWKC
jgi:uncharacterized protein (DUF2237 family)